MRVMLAVARILFVRDEGLMHGFLVIRHNGERARYRIIDGWLVVEKYGLPVALSIEAMNSLILLPMPIPW